MRSYGMVSAKTSKIWWGGLTGLEEDIRSLGYQAHTFLGIYDVAVLFQRNTFEKIATDIERVKELKGVAKMTPYSVVKEKGTPFVIQPFAYVFTQTVPSMEEKVVDELSRQRGVVASSIVHGPYDVISEVEANSLEKFVEIYKNMGVPGVVMHNPHIRVPNEINKL